MVKSQVIRPAHGILCLKLPEDGFESDIITMGTYLFF